MILKQYERHLLVFISDICIYLITNNLNFTFITLKVNVFIVEKSNGVIGF
jgi:hypothetical protein